MAKPRSLDDVVNRWEAHNDPVSETYTLPLRAARSGRSAAKNSAPYAKKAKEPYANAQARGEVAQIIRDTYFTQENGRMLPTGVSAAAVKVTLEERGYDLSIHEIEDHISRIGEAKNPNRWYKDMRLPEEEARRLQDNYRGMRHQNASLPESIYEFLEERTRLPSAYWQNLYRRSGKITPVRLHLMYEVLEDKPGDVPGALRWIIEESPPAKER